MRSYGSRVYAHPEEIPVIDGRRRMYSRSKLISIIGAIARPRPVKGVIDVHTLSMPGIDVIETPGHTTGSVTLSYTRDGERYLFVGDAAFEREGRLEVNRRYSLDVGAAERSLRLIMSLSPRLCPRATDGP